MSTVKAVLKAQPRTVVGKQVKQLRRDGLVPGIIYGRQEPVIVQLNALELHLALRGAGDNDLFNLEVSGKNYSVLARDVQRHATRRDLIHVDFLEVSMDQIIESEAELHFVGKSPIAVLGRISHLVHTIAISAKPNDLVSTIEVDEALISDVNTANTIYVRDIPVPAGVTILSDPDLAVAKFEYLAQEGTGEGGEAAA